MKPSSLRDPAAARREARRRELPAGAKLSLAWEIVNGGLIELWAHKLRSTLTLTLLMLGVFALVVMSSVIDGVMDKIGDGFAGHELGRHGHARPKSPETTEEQKRFAMSPGLRDEDLARITAPDPRVFAYLPRATKQSAVKVAGGTERIWVNGVSPDYGL